MSARHGHVEVLVARRSVSRSVDVLRNVAPLAAAQARTHEQIQSIHKHGLTSFSTFARGVRGASGNLDARKLH